MKKAFLCLLILLLHGPVNGLGTGMQIFIRLLSGIILTLDVDSSDTIENVKQKIEDKLPVPVAKQRLLLSNLLLDNGRTLGDYNIQRESTLNLGIDYDPVIYVSKTANGNKTGLSWTDAFTDLQSALLMAQAGDQIWVAAGTYYPDEGPSQTNNNRDASFVIPSGVVVYGGFPTSGEPTLTSRNWVTYPTILSGDLMQNDGSEFSGYDDNSYTVLTTNYVSSQTELNGLVMRGGNGGETKNGGALYNNGSGSGKQSTPRFVNCSFIENQARNGAAVFNDGRQGNSSPTFLNCIFRNNKATRDGGALYNFGGYSGNSSPTLTNCLIVSNKALRIAGGIFNDAVDAIGGTSSPTITNCTFALNQADFGVGALYSDGRNGGVSTPAVRNCIVSGTGTEIDDNTATTTISNSITPPTDPLFVNAAAGDFRVSQGSPAVNAGNNSFIPNEVITDFAGNPRRFNNGVVDAGAYELQCETPAITLGSIEPICANLTSFRMPYSNAVGSPVTYSIRGRDVVEVTDQPLPQSSIEVALSRAPGPLVSFTITVKTANGCISEDILGSVSVKFPIEMEVKVFEPTCEEDGVIILKAKYGALTQISYSIGGTAYGVGGTRPTPYNTPVPQTVVTIPKGNRPLTNYYLRIRGTLDGCEVIANNLNIPFTAVSGCCPSEPLVLSSNSPICVGNTIRLTASSGWASYAWVGPNGFSTNLQNPTRLNCNSTMSGIYSLTVRTGNCTASATTSVVVSPNVAPSITSLRFNNVLPNAQNTVSACSNAAVSLNIAATNAVTYSWRGPTGAGSGFASSLVSPVTMPITTPRQGQYTVSVRNGCTVFNQRVINLQLINCSNTRLASTEDTEAIEVKVNAYPNPVSKMLTVEVRLKEAQPLQLKLLNSVGQSSGTWQLSEPSTVHRTELNLSGLTDGVYLLEAQAGKQRAVKRVVKIRDE